jgi:hypothetical protein
MSYAYIEDFIFYHKLVILLLFNKKCNLTGDSCATATVRNLKFNLGRYSSCGSFRMSVHFGQFLPEILMISVD